MFKAEFEKVENPWKMVDEREAPEEEKKGDEKISNFLHFLMTIHDLLSHLEST